MLRRQVSARDAALLFFIVLAAIYALYWRGLVYRPLGTTPGRGGGGMGGGRPVAVGREDVLVETLAGGEPGFRDGAGWAARFEGPNALALAPGGSLFVADSRNHRIRHVTPGGRVTTAAGGGDPGGLGPERLEIAEHVELGGEPGGQRRGTGASLAADDDRRAAGLHRLGQRR